MDRKAFDDIATEFQIKLYETAVSLGRDTIELLAELAELYTRTGEYEKGLSLDKTLVQREPDNPIFLYNLACSLSLVNQIDKAYMTLDQALNLGFNDIKLLLEDRDLKNLHKDPRWSDLLKRIGNE